MGNSSFHCHRLPGRRLGNELGVGREKESKTVSYQGGKIKFSTIDRSVSSEGTGDPEVQPYFTAFSRGLRKMSWHRIKQVGKRSLNSLTLICNSISHQPS